MKQESPIRARNFPSAKDEVKAVQPHGRYDGPDSSFRMAFADSEFLLREELRPVRLQLELQKAELIQQEQGVESTVVVFGSARFKAPDVAAAMHAEALASGDKAALRKAEVMVRNAHWYTEAQRFGELVTREADALDARARRVRFTPTGLAWLQAFRDAVAQAEAEFRAEVGNEVATVVAIGLEAYASGL